MIMLASYLQNKDRPPRGWRYPPELLGLANILHTLLNDADYDKVQRVFSGALPTPRTLKLTFSFAPPLEGFLLDQFAKMKACWVHELALLLAVSPEEADRVMRSSPYVSLAQDETSIRKAFQYIPEYDHIIGPAHNNVTFHFQTFGVDQFLTDHKTRLLAEKVDCYVLKLTRFPQLAPFLLAVIPTLNTDPGMHGTRALSIRDLAAALQLICGFRLYSYGCDGWGRHVQNHLSLVRDVPRKFVTPEVPDMATIASTSAEALEAYFRNRGLPLQLRELSLSYPIPEGCEGPIFQFSDPCHLLPRSDRSFAKGVRIGDYTVSYSQTILPLLARLEPPQLVELYRRRVRLDDFKNKVFDKMNISGRFPPHRRPRAPDHLLL